MISEQMLLEAIQLNNEGARLLQDNQSLAEVSNKFLSALSTIENNESSSPISTLYSALLQQPQPQQSQAAQVEDSNDHTTFIYREPIVISSTKGDCCCCGSSAKALILFNLALTMHLIAIQRGSPKSLLRKCLELYEVVFALQSKKQHSHHNNNYELNFEECLGLVNNCGQIHKSLKRQGKANRLFQHLLSTLMVAISRDEEVPANVEGFFSSTCHLILDSPEAARAA